MVRILKKRSNHSNLFKDYDSTLTTDEFICKNKAVIKTNKRLMNLFFCQYMPYLYKTARRIRKTYPLVELDALVNEGFEGMLKALGKYNSDYASFLTYAQYWVTMKMNTFAQKASLSVKLPGSIHSALGKFRHVMQTNPDISDEELEEILCVTPKMLQVLKQAAALQVTSKDLNDQSGAVPDEDLTDLNTHPDTVDQVFIRVVSSDMERLLIELLPEKERYVVTSLFGLSDGNPKVLERVGKVLNVSKERVRQIKEFAFGKLRESEAIREFI